ncbi:hypothetical protein UFOVP770_45 [uncultured Caudovirales phage]|uniref:Uncharacterized protein n=1 Tax=uncultured Caudovirales phage TaxID=2100421 RepID=A0A6J5NQV0_9CAUD|nr:hypothetical protein UFOVP770_45 [uncultured Caudovirales phage]
MADKNPITGDLLQSRMNTKEFEENFDRIFGKKKRSDDISPHAYEYELNKSTGEVEKRFIDGTSKPNGEQFGNESDSTES